MEKKYQCRQCKQMLDQRFYYKDDRTANGLKGICKNCLRENYIANREKKIAYQKKYIKENHDRFIQYQREYNKKINTRGKIVVNQEKISISS